MLSQMSRDSSRLFKLGQVLLILGIVNFLSFVLVSLAIGGSASSGRIIDGRYYVAVSTHYTEVSRGVWWYSETHAISNFVTFPLMVVGSVVAGRERTAKVAR